MDFLREREDWGILPMGDGTYVDTQTNKVYAENGRPITNNSLENYCYESRDRSEQDERTSPLEIAGYLTIVAIYAVGKLGKKVITCPFNYIGRKTMKLIGNAEGFEDDEI